MRTISGNDWSDRSRKEAILAGVESGIYTVGGTVQANQKGLYIPRCADQELLNLCRQSKFAYVLTPRQMGKSSLMIRTAERLIDEGIR